MAAPQNGTESAADIELEALINEVDEKDVSEVVSSLNQEFNSTDRTKQPQATVDEGPKAFQDRNGTQDTQQVVLDLTKPIKTEGESSSSLQSAPLVIGSAESVTAPRPRAGSLPLESLNNATSKVPFSLSPLGGGMIPANLQLSNEEQSALYRQASILAVSATAKSSGEKAKEILTIVSKVKDFLTHLIQLAGNSGPSVKAAVQSLVQKLMVSLMRCPLSSFSSMSSECRPTLSMKKSLLRKSKRTSSQNTNLGCCHSYRSLYMYFKNNYALVNFSFRVCFLFSNLHVSFYSRAFLTLECTSNFNNNI